MLSLCYFTLCILLLQFITVQKEVEERQRFIEEMESIGQGEKFRTIINTEISQVSQKITITLFFSCPFSVCE